jgi:hypothetical protein
MTPLFGEYLLISGKKYVVVNMYTTANPELFDYALTESTNVANPALLTTEWQKDNCWYLTNRELDYNKAISLAPKPH